MGSKAELRADSAGTMEEKGKGDLVVNVVELESRAVYPAAGEREMMWLGRMSFSVVLIKKICIMQYGAVSRAKSGAIQSLPAEHPLAPDQSKQ